MVDLRSSTEVVPNRGPNLVAIWGEPSLGRPIHVRATQEQTRRVGWTICDGNWNNSVKPINNVKRRRAGNKPSPDPNGSCRSHHRANLALQ